MSQNPMEDDMQLERVGQQVDGPVEMTNEQEYRYRDWREIMKNQ